MIFAHHKMSLARVVTKEFSQEKCFQGDLRRLKQVPNLPDLLEHRLQFGGAQFHQPLVSKH
jgi:hypothetical protein